MDFEAAQEYRSRLQIDAEIQRLDDQCFAAMLFYEDEPEKLSVIKIPVEGPQTFPHTIQLIHRVIDHREGYLMKQRQNRLETFGHIKNRHECGS